MIKEYIGIVDDDGLDMLRDPGDANILELRMRLNSHRNPMGVRLFLGDDDVKKVKSFAESQRSNKNAKANTIEFLTKLSKEEPETTETIDF